ncbi:MAG: sodium:calcium antiporter [Salinarimonas sp.]
MIVDLSAGPLWLVILVFALAAAVVWYTGTRLAGAADEIAEVYGLGQAFVGMLLLGAVTSIPEVAVSVTAGIAGEASLAVNNLLGGVALQVVLLALGDALLDRRAFTGEPARPSLLLQPVLCAALLSLVAAGITVGEVAVLGVGLWSTSVFVAGIAFFWIVSRSHAREVREDGRGRTRRKGPHGLPKPVIGVAVLAPILVVAGYLLARSGDVIAEETGLGDAFVGLVLVSLATSLPEVSTIVGAVRRGRMRMAMGDIFGTNIFDIALVFVVDVAYREGPALESVGSFSVVAALLGVVLTLIYAAGLIERGDRRIGRLGVDSWAVLVVYAGGLAVLWTLR